MEKVLSLLKENMVCSVGTCYGDKPRVSVLEYIMVGDNVIFATDTESIKATNLKFNNRISFSVYAMPLFVTIDGSVTNPTEEEIGIYNNVLFEMHPEFKEMMAKGTMRPVTYYKLVPKTIYYNDYSLGMSPTEITELA